jgi:hypothetical protein
VSPYGVLRGFSGALTAGLAVLLVVLVGAWAAAVAAGTPGPGAVMLAGHLVAVAAAAFLQRVVDRRRGLLGLSAAGGVLLVVAAVVLVFWWD